MSQGGTKVRVPCPGTLILWQLWQHLTPLLPGPPKRTAHSRWALLGCLDRERSQTQTSDAALPSGQPLLTPRPELP